MYWLLEKQGKLYFLQSSQTKGRGVLLPPLQPGFAKDTAFLSAKTQKLQKALLFAIVRRSFMEGSCIGFWKSKTNSTFCKVVKQKGEACFCRLCNQVLPKTLRFSLQRQKAPEFGEAEFWDCTPVSCFTNALCQNSR